MLLGEAGEGIHMRISPQLNLVNIVMRLCYGHAIVKSRAVLLAAEGLQRQSDSVSDRLNICPGAYPQVDVTPHCTGLCTNNHIC